MKLLCLNVGLFIDNNASLKSLLKAQKPDFICLQEVTRSLEVTVDKTYVTKDIVDEATPDLKHFFFGPNTVMGDFEQKNFHGKELFSFKFGGLMEFGNYTRSNCKIVKAQNIFMQNSFTYYTDNSDWPEVDYRAVLVIDYIIDGKKLRVMNYHGVWTRNKQGSEMSLKANAQIKELALQSEGEVIICGDFNLFPDTPSMKLFENDFISLVDTYGIKSTRPASNELNEVKRNVVDYILISKGIKTIKFEVLESSVSDHLPLILEFEL